MEKCILLVEDYDDTRVMLERHIKQLGYGVVACEDGADAIVQFLMSFRCASNVGILMDLNLPDINGMRVLKAIREIEKGSTQDCVPIHMGIATASGSVVAGAPVFEELNVTLRLDKPFDPDILAPLLKAWLSSEAPPLYGKVSGELVVSVANGIL